VELVLADFHVYSIVRYLPAGFKLTSFAHRNIHLP
jgi:hypothetical protein